MIIFYGDAFSCDTMTGFSRKLTKIDSVPELPLRMSASLVHCTGYKVYSRGVRHVCRDRLNLPVETRYPKHVSCETAGNRVGLGVPGNTRNEELRNFISLPDRRHKTPGAQCRDLERRNSVAKQICKGLLKLSEKILRGFLL